MSSSRLKNGLSKWELIGNDLLFTNDFHKTKGALENLFTGEIFWKRAVREHDYGFKS